VDRALRFEDEGADIIDIGGESTRPGSSPVSADEELKRVLPVVEGIRKRSSLPLSIDTTKAEVVRKVLDLNVEMINDISGLGSDRWEELASAAAESRAWLVLMHMRGTPSDMQQRASYGDFMGELSSELDRSVQRAVQAGVGRDRIVLDPGIGFAKQAAHSLAVIGGLSFLKKMGFPLMVGLSRKSFLREYSGSDPEKRLNATTAAHAIAVFLGADILRVHDVREAVETARLVDDIKNTGQRLQPFRL
jgi:dihydropteroate synthase